MCCQYIGTDEWGEDQWSELVSFFITGITVLVVAIPEGLPLVIIDGIYMAFIRSPFDNDKNRIE